MAKLRFRIVALLFVGFNCVSVASLQAAEDKKEKRDVRDELELLGRLAQTPARPQPVLEVSL
ncbi:hypothetical protein FACS1894182_05180 [Bacteroidia bacterium]|nr:hypothetical protein FACS1894182_05180 [Bacteroidia bacterium]